MRDEKVKIGLFYHSIPVFITRVAIINLLIFLSLLLYISGNSPNFFLFLLSVFIIIEVFVKFSLEVVRPSASLNDNPQDIFDAFTKEALIAVFKKDNTPAFLTAVNKLKQTKFLLDKAVISEKEITALDVPTNELADKAAEITRRLKGKYITSTDLLTSYLVLTEATTKLLFNKKLKEEDIININHWARIIFEEEEPKEFKPRYAGVGIGELLVWGWTPETMKYTRDHTYSSIKRKTMVDGRESEPREDEAAGDGAEDHRHVPHDHVEGHRRGEPGTRDDGRDHGRAGGEVQARDARPPRGGDVEQRHRRFTEEAPDEQRRHADHEPGLREHEQESSVEVVDDRRPAEGAEREEHELHEPEEPERRGPAELERLDEDGEPDGAHRQTGRQHREPEQTEVAGVAQGADADRQGLNRRRGATGCGTEALCRARSGEPLPFGV